MGKFIDLTGRTFNRLTVLRRGDDYISPKGRRNPRWLCKCTCGRLSLVQTGSLQSGSIKSCGCLHIEQARQAGLNSKRENRYEIQNDYVVGFTRKGEPFYFDIEFLERVKPYCWYKANNGYIETRVRYSRNNARIILLHRLITDTPDGFVVDHINHKPEDNRLCNLRVVSRSENNVNKVIRSNNSSGFTGVSWNRQVNKWNAYIKYKGQKNNLGYYERKEAAIAARKAAEEKYFGQFSYSNSISAVPKIEQPNPPERVKSIFGGINETCINPRSLPKQPPVFASPCPAHLNGHPV